MTVKAKQQIPPFDAQQLEAIARVLADTNDGLKGSEIEHLLHDCLIPDTTPEMTKWKRLYNAFARFQNEHQLGNHVVVFVNKAMNPAKYTQCPEVFRLRREELNKILALCGMAIGDGGKIRWATKAASLDEALERANRLKAALGQRNVHSDVLKYCDAEIVGENYFHAVLEAVKSITAKIRSLSGLTCDGADLVDRAFGFGKNREPLLKINALGTETLQGEQRGFVSLLKGLYGTVRNPIAHEPKIEWDMSEQDALDILTMISLIHRKLDKTKQFASSLDESPDAN